MLLSWQILKQSPMMEHCQEIFWFWVVRGVEKRTLCKKLLVIICLGSWKEFIRSLALIFRKREKLKLSLALKRKKIFIILATNTN